MEMEIVKLLRDRDSLQKEVDLQQKTNSSTDFGEWNLGRSDERRRDEINKMISEMEEKLHKLLSRDKLEFEEKLETCERKCEERFDVLRKRNMEFDVYKTKLHDLELRMLKMEATLVKSAPIQDDFQDKKSIFRGGGSFHASPYCRCSLKIINVIKNNLHKENLEKLEQSCFGSLMKINQLRFQGQLMSHLLLHMNMDASNDKRQLVFNINNTSTIFGPNEFSLITGLCFGTSEAASTHSSSIHERAFHGRPSITLKNVEQAFLASSRDDEGRGELTLQLALLYFLYGVLLVSRGKINMQYLHLVEDLHKFNTYPWGRVAYPLLVSSTLSVRACMDASKYTHRKAPVDMYGFSFALQAWVYEVMPFVATHCAFSANNFENRGPLILRWFATKIFRFDDLKKFFTPGGNALVLSNIQDSPEQKNKKVKGEESTDTMSSPIREKCDDVGTSKRRLSRVEDRLESSLRNLDFSSDDDEALKNATQPASATTPTRYTTFEYPAQDKPQLSWKACSEFETSESEYERSKAMYESILHRAKHLKVWISYAKFEAFAMKEAFQESYLTVKRKCLDRARAVFGRAHSYFRTCAPELIEERAMLLEEWFDMESMFGELGDVDLVRAKLPQKLEKRRRVEAEDGPPRYEESVEYLFPDVQIVEAAHKWKNETTNKEMKVFERRVRSQRRVSWLNLNSTLSENGDWVE